MDSKINILKDKLNQFIKHYYINLILRGLIVVPLIGVSLIIMVSLLEYVGWFSINLRLFILLLTISSLLFIFFYFLLVPLLNYLGIGKTITNRFAAKILSNYFPEIKDNIINVLELDLLNTNDLVISSINQKIKKLDNIDFCKSISYKSNLKFGRYFLISLFVFIITLFWKPEIYTEATQRIIHYNTVYNKDVGFRISIDSSLLNIKRGDDINLIVNIDGDIVPEVLYINYGGSNFLVEKLTNKKFAYTFRNVNSNFSFSITNDYFTSSDFFVNVNNIPLLKNYETNIHFPKYLDRRDEQFKNLNEISVSKGSKLKFLFSTIYCDEILVIENDTILLESNPSNLFEYNVIANTNFTFSIDLFNAFTSIRSVISINVQVIPDLYPSIKVSYVKDNNNFRLFYFKGIIEDDYGFSNLSFTNTNSIVDIQYLKNQKSQEFYYAYEFPLDENNQEVYFTVFDNDRLNGFKSTKSEIIKIEIPTLEEFSNKENETFNELSNKLDKSLLMAYELKRDIEEIQKSLINDNLEVWEKQSKLKAIESKHKKLEEIIKAIAQENLNKDNFKNSFLEEQKDLVDKQKQIQELLDNVLSDELKKLMEEINKLSEDFDQNKLNDLSKELEMNYDDLSEKLDRNLELLKRFELEERISNTIDRIKKLSDDQEKLSDMLKSKESEKQESFDLQKESIEKFNKIEEDYNEVIEKNSELIKQMNLQDFDEDFKSIDDDLNSNEIGVEKKNKEGSENAKKASDKLSKLAESMQSMLDSNSKEENAEDAETLRQILENLFVFSFKQESLYQSFQFIDQDNPRYVKLINDQNNLSEDYSIIRDSLYALGKRSSHIGTHITRSAFNIETKLFDVNKELTNNRLSSARRHQRDLMTNTNDMILLLSESLKNMDSMGSGSGSGKKKSKKPKKGDKPSLSDMQKGQDGLKKQLEDMLSKMKGEGKGSKQGMDKLGKSLAQQEIMQQMLNKMLNNGGVGKEATKKLEEIKRLMEANKRDLVNMNISSRMLNRQKQIMTRLLEAENAEMERDKDNQREAHEAFRYLKSNPDKLFDDKPENINFNEIFNSKSLNLFDFYKYKYQEYLMKVNDYTNEKRN